MKVDFFCILTIFFGSFNNFAIVRNEKYILNFKENYEIFTVHACFELKNQFRYSLLNSWVDIQGGGGIGLVNCL